MDDELFHLLRLIQMRGVGSMAARHLLAAFGSARATLEADSRLLLDVPRVGQAIVEQRSDTAITDRARRELDFIRDHHIHVVTYGQSGYPRRLADCPDAPALLFSTAGTPLDRRRMLAIVGTRSATQYGRDAVRDIVVGLASAVPELVVVSGLALGIDVAAHRAALDAGIPTVAVVAHGLDRIYPATHRGVARQMAAASGGVTTEYMTDTEPMPGNFLARNRIIAGLADAVVVAESKEKGGAIVTASIASTYNRDVFAVPGRTCDSRSAGCNRLIRLNRAALVTSATDIIEMMNWDDSAKLAHQTQLAFPAETSTTAKLSSDERRVVEALQEHGKMASAQIAAHLELPLAYVTEALLTLEMEGYVRPLPGGAYETR